MATTQLSKWGHSLAVRIPKGVAQSAGLSEGDSLDVVADDAGAITIRAARRTYSLDELVSRITKKNRHDELEWGDLVGKEVW